MLTLSKRRVDLSPSAPQTFSSYSKANTRPKNNSSSTSFCCSTYASSFWSFFLHYEPGKVTFAKTSAFTYDTQSWRLDDDIDGSAQVSRMWAHFCFSLDSHRPHEYFFAEPFDAALSPKIRYPRPTQQVVEGVKKGFGTATAPRQLWYGCPIAAGLKRKI